MKTKERTMKNHLNNLWQ